jgi:hypothetical protein
MERRLSLACLVAGTLMIAAAYASAFLPGGAPTWAAWLFALGTPLTFVASMALGASGPRGLGRLRWVFLLVFVILAGGFGAVLAMPAVDPADPTLFLGLPPRTAIILLGVGLLPLLVLPLAYALTFDQTTLSEDDLARVREAALAARAAQAAAAEASRTAAEPAPAPVGGGA